MVKEIFREILHNVGKTLDSVDSAEVSGFIEKITDSKNIFIFGAGRSGLIAKTFAMRLMHLGFTIYVIGETITPSVKEGDLLIAISGSGKTNSTIAIAKTAKELGVKIAAITSYEDSPLAKLSDTIVKISGRITTANDDYASRQLMGEHEPLTPMGTLFELSVMIFLDSVTTKLMRVCKKKEEEMKKNHANLE